MDAQALIGSLVFRSSSYFSRTGKLLLCDVDGTKVAAHERRSTARTNVALDRHDSVASIRASVVEGIISLIRCCRANGGTGGSLPAFVLKADLSTWELRRAHRLRTAADKAVANLATFLMRNCPKSDLGKGVSFADAAARSRIIIAGQIRCPRVFYGV